MSYPSRPCPGLALTPPRGQSAADPPALTHPKRRPPLASLTRAHPSFRSGPPPHPNTRSPRCDKSPQHATIGWSHRPTGQALDGRPFGDYRRIPLDVKQVAPCFTAVTR